MDATSIRPQCSVSNMTVLKGVGLLRLRCGPRIRARVVAPGGDGQAGEVVRPAGRAPGAPAGLEAAVDQPQPRSVAVRGEGHLDHARLGDAVLVALPAPGEDHAMRRAHLEVGAD